MVASRVTLLGGVATCYTLAVRAAQTAIMTPHDEYSSAVGVLGCYIDTNRVAYWPSPVSCDGICVRVHNTGRSLNLLKIDTSEGAYDISYDAWNYLAYGAPASQNPQQGGGVAMEYEVVSPDNCRSLLIGGKLAFSAANSMNFITYCLKDRNSFVAQNFELINLLDPTCNYGWDEKCMLADGANQPICGHQLGDPHQPTGQRVTNVRYGTGIEQTASG